LEGVATMEENKKLVYFLYMKGEDIVGVDVESSVHRNEAVIVCGSTRKRFAEQNDILFYGKLSDERPTLEEVFKAYIGFEIQGVSKDEMHSQIFNHFNEKKKTR
jgi:hypothetical protein